MWWNFFSTFEDVFPQKEGECGGEKNPFSIVFFPFVRNFAQRKKNTVEPCNAYFTRRTEAFRQPVSLGDGLPARAANRASGWCRFFFFFYVLNLFKFIFVFPDWPNIAFCTESGNRLVCILHFRPLLVNQSPPIHPASPSLPLFASRRSSLPPINLCLLLCFLLLPIVLPLPLRKTNRQEVGHPSSTRFLPHLK